MTKLSWVASGLLVATAALAFLILAFLSEEVTLHFYALTLFLLLDLVLAGLVLLRPSKTTFSLVAVWAALRVVLFVGGVFAPILQAPSAEDNPAEFQVLELMTILQIGLTVVALRARSTLIRP